MNQHIAIYLRVSLEDYLGKEDAKKESDSIFSQRRIIMKYIKEDDGLSRLPMTEFVDDGFTGTNFERPFFQDMLEKIKTGRISCVIVKDLSRFGRNYLEVGDYLEHLFPFLGIRFIAVNDNYDSEDYAGMNAGVDIAFKNILHDYYSRDLSVKVRTAQRTRMKAGKYVNVPPFGYLRDPEDKHHLIIDPKTAPVVRTIFEKMIAGVSSSDVATYLNEKHIPTPLQSCGRKRKPGMLLEKDLIWTHQAVLNILSNYKYTGAMVNHSRENQTLRAKAQKRLPQSEWIINENMHEAIVSHEEFKLARKALREVKKYSRKEPDFTTSVYYCAHCGRMLRKTYGKTTYMSCQTFKYIPDADCQSIRWTLPDLEETLFEAFKIQIEFLRKIKAEMKPEKEDRDGEFVHRISSLCKMKDSVMARKTQLYTEFKTGHLSKEQFLGQKTQLTKEVDRITEDLKKAKDSYEDYLEQDALYEDRRKSLDQFLPAKGASDDEIKKLMYTGVDKVLVWNDGSLDISWKFHNVFEPYMK